MAKKRAKWEEEARTERTRVRWSFASKALPHVGAVLRTGMIALPVLAFGWAVKPFAGVESIVDVNLVASITVGISVTVNGVQWGLGRFRKEELQRLRDQIKRLEDQNDAILKLRFSNPSSGATGGGSK